MLDTIEYSAGCIVIFKAAPEPLYLLLKQKSSYWSFPKGHLEDGEELLDTASRELTEETGITEFDVLPFPPIPVHYTFYTPSAQIQKIVHLFVALVHSQDITIQLSEIDDFTWEPYEEALKLLNFPPNCEALASAHSQLLAI